MITWRFTDASGGNLAAHVGDGPTVVARNRGALADALGIEATSLAFMNQVHGDVVAMASGSTPDADALVTTESGLALVVLVADCIPLLLSDQEQGVVAAVHVGRRGLVNGIALKTVEKMRTLGADRIEAMMGPAICGQCYEVPAELQREVLKGAPAAGSVTREGTPGLDIRNGLRPQLESMGLTVSIDPRCTRESQELFSYRRNKETGRFAGVIMVA